MQAYESLLDTVVKNLPTGAIVIRGSDLRILLVNPSYQAIAHGKDLEGKTIEETWPEIQPRFGDLCRQVLSTGESYSAVNEPFSIRRTSGGLLESCYFTWSLIRIPLPGNDGWGLLDTIIETTESKRTEEALRESEKSYRQQFAGNSAVMLLIDPEDGAIIDANTTALSFYGHPYEQMLTMRISDINTMPASEVQQAMTSVQQEHGKHFEFQHRLADGSVRSVEVSSSKIQFGGRIVLHSIIHDITERKQAQESLRASEERYREIVEHAANGILLGSSEGRITGANSKMQLLAGRPLDQLV